MNLIQTLEAEQIAELTKIRAIPEFRPGDTLRVGVKVIEGDRTRVQAFEGVCIARSNKGVGSSFTVRKISFGEGVERVFPLYSPRIAGMFGPQAAYFAELFSTRLRYSGFAFARELGSLLAGGPAPALSAALVIWTGGLTGVALYVMVLALLTALALYFGPETYKTDITVEQVKA